jgi:hypothetical protein
MNKSNKNKNRGSGSRRGEMREKRPPPFIPTILSTHNFRYVNNSVATAVPITRANLLNLVQVATTAITTTRIIAAVRLMSVEIWTPPPTTLGLAVCEVEWKGLNSPSTIKADNSMGVLPAHVHTSPPSDASERWWSVTGSNETEQLFTITCSAFSVVDVVVKLRFVDDEAPAAGDIPAAATIGKVYYNYLDGLSSTTFIPSGGVAILP